MKNTNGDSMNSFKENGNSMKRYSWKFWILFWLISAVLLGIWYGFLEVKSKGFGAISDTAKFLPVSGELRGDIEAVADLADKLLVRDGKTRTYLVLFQNNHELRPGGGFIGSFGIVKVKDGSVSSVEVHDTANFDGRIPSTIAPPYPMKETLNIDSWKLRDSNYSPDFPTNVEKATMFYEMGGGEEMFDGVIGITTDVLERVLTITGPITVPGYPGVYSAENATELLQYQVEVGYKEQSIEKGDRKMMMNDLAGAIIDAIGPLDVSRKIQLAREARNMLYEKTVQLSFADSSIQGVVRERGWDGVVDARWKNDYLFIVDANLGAYKSDRLMERSVAYSVDFSSGQGEVEIQITYRHTAKEKDWKTNDYQSYMRIYVPDGAWLSESDGLSHSIRYGEEFGRKYFGTIVQVPIGQTKIFTFRYTLPESISGLFYDLKIQKQAGTNAIPYKTRISLPSGEIRSHSFSLSRDTILSDVK
jgi:hypothetical protein